MIRWLARRAVIELDGLRVRAGYWLRPYDMTADRRRWRWQPSAACGFRTFAEMPAKDRAALIEAVQAASAHGQEPQA